MIAKTNLKEQIQSDTQATTGRAADTVRCAGERYHVIHGKSRAYEAMG